MKKILFLICALPCLLSAQNAPVKNVLKEKTAIQQVIKNLSADMQEQAVSLRADPENNRLDSIYTYSDKAKKTLTKKTHIEYLTDGRKRQAKHYEIWSYGTIYESKTEYAYRSISGKLVIEELFYYWEDGSWDRVSKMVYVFNRRDLANPEEIYSYQFEDDWKLFMQAIVVEYDDDGRPTVYEVESPLFEGENSMKVAYNEDGLVKSRTLLTSDDYTNITEYEYDAKGNVIHMTDRDEKVINKEEYYTNFYPSITSNEVIRSIQSSIYPNPASDVLHVSIADAGEALITLVNLTGSIVYQQKTSQPITSVPVESLAKGYYILTIQATGQTETHKVIIH